MADTPPPQSVPQAERPFELLDGTAGEGLSVQSLLAPVCTARNEAQPGESVTLGTLGGTAESTISGRAWSSG